MRFKWEIICDYHDEAGELPDEENIRDEFSGSADELAEFIEWLRSVGCRNIFFNALGAAPDEPEEEEDLWEEEYVDPWEEAYIRSVTGGDYSSANPWDAPGMSVSDFI